MRIIKWISGAALVAVVASVVSGCYVESRPRWRSHYYRPAPVVYVR